MVTTRGENRKQRDEPIVAPAYGSPLHDMATDDQGQTDEQDQGSEYSPTYGETTDSFHMGADFTTH
jgi:hypothetical protein